MGENSMLSLGLLEYGMLAALFVLCYFFGCFNGAVIVSKYILRDDVRNHGSGNAGLTNFYRTFGGALTLVVIFTDFFKGVLSILAGTFVANQLGITHEGLIFARYLAGAGCQVGHMFPVTFGFKGGKGVLSGGAIALMLDWRIAVIVWGGFFLLVIAFRYVSLGSIWAGGAFVVATACFYPYPGVIAMGAIIGGQLLWGHRGNIQRLLAGTESKFVLRKKKS